MTHQYIKLPMTMKMWMQFNVMPRRITIVDIIVMIIIIIIIIIIMILTILAIGVRCESPTKTSNKMHGH